MGNFHYTLRGSDKRPDRDQTGDETGACAVGCSDFHFFFIFLGISTLPSLPWDPRVQKM
jgi:hypothetical protein